MAEVGGVLTLVGEARAPGTGSNAQFVLEFTRPGGSTNEYSIERCTGAACTAFVEVGTTFGSTYAEFDSVRATTYRYRVVSLVPGSAYSNILTVTTNAQPRQTTTIYETDLLTHNVAFSEDVLAGSLLCAVAIGWAMRTITSVTDTQGNVWQFGVARTFKAESGTANPQAIGLWFTTAGHAGPCTVTIVESTTFEASNQFNHYVFEFDLPYTVKDASGTNLFPAADDPTGFTGAGGEAFPLAASGMQTAAGLMLSLGNFDTSCGGTLVPTGFHECPPAGSCFRTGYRITSVPETLTGRTILSEPNNTRLLGAMIAFRTPGHIPPAPTTPPASTIDTAVPCCGSAATGGGTATGPILPAISTAWIPRCVGGGAVPTAPDLTDSELWT